MKKTFIEQVHYIRIPVRDLDQSAKWYEEVLGLQLLTITDDPFAIIKVNDGPFLVILVPMMMKLMLILLLMVNQLSALALQVLN